MESAGAGIGACGVTRPAGPFAAPPPRQAPKVKRDTSEEAAERRHVWSRDRGCIAPLLVTVPGGPRVMSACDGERSFDHVRASGGLGMKSPTHRSNGVILCLHHHRCKTEYGRVWRPLLLDYIERMGDAA